MKTNKNNHGVLKTLSQKLRVTPWLLPLFLPLLMLLSCEQPFKAGLGPVIDIRPPTVKLDAPGAGEYIWGNRIFVGTAEDDYKLETVELKVTNYPDERNPFLDYVPVALKMKGPNKATWEIEIDTSLFTNEFGDGDLKVRLKATDSVGKVTETDEVAFFIKNEPPEVIVTSPYVASGDSDGNIGRGKLNWGVAGYGQPLASGSFIRKLDKGAPISGTITYEEDIYRGGDHPEDGKDWYAPQIRLWRVGPDAGSYAPDVLPPLSEIGWQPLPLLEPPLGIGRYQFSLPLDEEPGYFYGFEIRVLSKDGRASFHYPRDFYPPSWSADDEKENRYVIFYLKLQVGTPSVSLYEGNEDLSDWNGTYYETLHGDWEDDLGLRAIVSTTDETRNGPFTLRYRATYQENIRSAEIYWEREGSIPLERGRFIWDPAEGEPVTNGYYTWWGEVIPEVPGVDPGRNFVFTYTHPSGSNESAKTAPADAPLVGGKSTVQQYSGGADWNKAKKDGSLVTDTNWTDVKSLKEGIYKIEVYARSSTFATGEVNYPPARNTVRLDLTAPTARVTTINGAAQTNTAMSEATVNGVIEPVVSFSDWRTATKEYYNQGTSTSPVFGAEQIWLLVKEGDNNQLDTLINNANVNVTVPADHKPDGKKHAFWPPVPASPTDPMYIPNGGTQINVIKHGPVFDSQFMFKTSKLFASGETESTGLVHAGPLEALPDGKYYLYVFGRDDAFNATYTTPILIDVKAETDLPKIIARSETDDGVTTPNLVTVTNPPTGFEIGSGAWRNRLSPGANIRLQLSDDDGLDLGTGTPPAGTAPAGGSVTFVAAQAANATGGGIVPLTGSYVVNLDLRTIFGSQATGTGDAFPGGRERIRTSQVGTISQTDLVSALKAGAAGSAYKSWGLFGAVTAETANPEDAFTNNLPNGIYLLQIKASDFAAHKLRMNGEGAPVVKNATIDIWIFVDTAEPTVNISPVTVPPASAEGWLNPTDGLGAGQHGVTLTATVSDANGPLKVKGFKIVDGKGVYTDATPSTWTQANGTYVLNTPSEISITPTHTGSSRLWTGDLTAKVHINRTVNAPNGIKVFIEIEDRFGRSRIESRTFQVDLEAPTVGLVPIPTFERIDDVRVNITGTNEERLRNQGRLVNGVVSFNISANDNRSVREVRYWILPKGTAFGGWGKTTYSTTETASKKYVYVPRTSNFSMKTFLDTAADLTDDTEYNFYVMAEDSATLKSPDADALYPNGALLQTFYVRQQEDAPYFEKTGSFEPQAGGAAETVVGLGEMNLSITVTDDDGFFNSSDVVTPNMFTVYVSTAAASLPGDVGSPTITAGTGAVVWPAITNVGNYTAYVPNNAHTGVSITGSKKNVTLTIDLNNVVENQVTTAFYNKITGDGRKHFIIEATDSSKEKYYNNGGTWEPAPDNATYKRMWRQYVSMVVDITDPVVLISTPALSTGTAIPVFGENIHVPAGTADTNRGFEVKGYLADVYLKRTADSHYYFTLKLDGTDLTFGGISEFKLGTAANTPAGYFIDSIGTTQQGGVSTPTVNFTIPSETFLAAIGYYTQTTGTNPQYVLGHGQHSLTFTAEDQSRKTGAATINFVRDLKAPEFRFASGFNDNKVTIPVINSRAWWLATTNPGDYTAKRGHPQTTPAVTVLPSVSYEAVTGTPTANDIPSITGTFSDDYSNIDTASFKVKFDGGDEIAIPAGQLTGTGTNYNWTVYLTQDGTPAITASNQILTDGVHSIQLRIADVSGNNMTQAEYDKMYGFRIISKTPESKLLNVTPQGGTAGPVATARKVYGDRATNATTNPTTATVFTITGEATGYNLAPYATATSTAPAKPVELIIRYTDTVTVGGTPLVFEPQKIAPPSGTWSYTIKNTAPNVSPPAGIGREEVLEKYSWSYALPRSVVLAAGRGGSGQPALTTMRAGNYEIVAVAYDRSAPNAKKSEEIEDNVWQFVIDSTKPEFSFVMNYTDYAKPENNILVSDNTSSTPVSWLSDTDNRNVIQDSLNPRIRGSVTDNNELSVVELQISKWDYTNANQTGTAAWQVYRQTSAAPGGGSWETGVGTDNNQYWIRLASNINATDYKVEWTFDEIKNYVTAGLEDGYYRVRMRARDASTSYNGSNTTWTGDTSNGNPAYSPYAFFFLDRDPPEVTPDESGTGFYSSRTNLSMGFKVDVGDLNRIDSITATLIPVDTSPAHLPGPAVMSLGQGVTTMQSGATPWTGTRAPTLTITDPYAPPTVPNYLPDGTYRVSFVVTDLAGRATTKNHTIKIDNQPPTAAITEPREAATGSETFIIMGSTGDVGPNGSASGLSSGNANAGIWYHIGYGSQTALPAFTGSETPQQRSDLIKTWVLGTGSTVTADNGVASNAAFNTASMGIAPPTANASLWFRYTQAVANPGTTANYIVPTGFAPITTAENSIDLLNWTLDATATVVNTYSTGSVSIRNTTYSTTTPRRLARPSEDPSRRSTHSLPIVVRVVDNAGNVCYEMYDIRLDPYGDNPKSVINNPPTRFMETEEKTAEEQPRGGQVQINGVAKDNVGVRRVIYRVKADDVREAAPGYGSAPDDDKIVTIPGKTAIPATSWNNMLAGSPTDMYNGGQTNYNNTITKTGWYDATVESPESATSSWSFMLNESKEIDAVIASRGFNHVDGTTTNRDMIRVWVEVMVFDQTPTGANNLMSLGDKILNRATGVILADIDAARPRPYIREFYFTTSAPKVLAPKISVLNSTTVFEDYTSQLAQDNIRSGQFAIKATLSGNGPIGEIRVKLPDEDNAPKVVYNGNTAPTTNGVTVRNAADNAAVPANANEAVLTYVFDTTATTNPSPTAQWVKNGSWATSGDTYRIEVFVRDTQTPFAEDSYVFEVGIDNFVPLADTKKNITKTKVAGTNETFQGRAFDFTKAANADAVPPNKGIQEVRVWFTNSTDTSFINMDTGAVTAKASVTQTPNMTVRTGRSAEIGWDGDSVGSITDLVVGTLNTAFSHPSQSGYLKTLNALPQDGVTWATNINDGSDVSWLFTQDTTKFPDGWMIMHYVVVDNAGNASYYSQTMIVMNKVPMITHITLYTNNTGQGAVFTTHEGDEAFSEYELPYDSDGRTIPFANGYLDSGFIAKNSTIGFGVDTFLPGAYGPPLTPATGEENQPYTYRVRYVERYKVPLSADNLAVMAARTGTLSYINDSGATDTAAVGGFENLYTIAEGMSRNINADGWKILGVLRATPVDGTHFEFGGGRETLDITGMDYPTVMVYAYKMVGGTDGVVKALAPRSNTQTPEKVNPGDFNFVGSTYFGGEDKINEAQAKNTKNTYYTEETDTGLPAYRNATEGTAFFLIKVWDTVNHGVASPTGIAAFTEKDMLFDAVVIGMKVYVGDRRRPFARLYDLNPYMEKAVVGSNVGAANQQATLNDAADPTGIGENITRGSLYNLGTEREPVKSGYIDPRSGANNDTTALNPWANYPGDPLSPYTKDVNGTWETTSQRVRADGLVTNDAVAITGTAVRDKVSGSVILRGLAWDDQLIDQITLDIGGTKKTILKLQRVKVNNLVDNAIVYDGFGNEEILLDSDTTSAFIRKMRPIRTVTAGTDEEITYVPATSTTPAKQTAWVYEEIHWQTGHTVEWAYLWDTEAATSLVDSSAPPVTITRGDRGGPAWNIPITVIVRDYNSSTTPTARLTNNLYTADTPAANPTSFHNKVDVDIVPYISGFKRADRFATTRSRQGWYSFYRGETGIRVLGYNLGSSGSTTIVYLNSAGTTANGDALTANRSYTANTNIPNNGHIFAIPDATTSSSGKITLTVGSTTNNGAWNHSSIHTNKSWNKENSVTGADLWINKPYAHIWRSLEDDNTPVTYFGNNTGSGGSWALDSPSMVLEYGATSGATEGTAEGEMTSGAGAVPGRLHGAWGIRENFGVYYGANDNKPRIRLQVAQDPMSLTDMSYYPGTNNANNLTAVYVYQWDSLPNLLVRTHMKYIRDASGDPALGVNNGGTIAPYLIRRDNRGSQYLRDTYSWQNVRTSMTMANTNTGDDNEYRPHDGNGPQTANGEAGRGNAGRVYTSGYDSAGNTITQGYKNLFFVERAGFTNYPAPSGTTLPLFIDGGNADSAVSDLAAINANYDVTTRVNRAGNWSAIDYVTNGEGGRIVPVIAYYDETNDTLRLAYGNSAGTNNSNGTGDRWTRRYVLPNNDNLYRGSGKYVSMKVDRANNIHLAFLNTVHNTVVYAVGTRTGAFTAYAIDNVVPGGTWTDISVDNYGNPWITYGNTNRTGNYDGVRIAYKSTGTTGTSTGAFTRTLYDPINTTREITGWEAVTMPANYTIADDRLNIEAWPPIDRRATQATLAAASPNGSWHAAVGYSGTDRSSNTSMFRVGYFFKPANGVVTTFQTTGN